MAAGPKKAKRRGPAKTGVRSVSTKGRPATDTSPTRQDKSQARFNAPAKKASQKPARGRRTAASLHGAGRMDSVLAAQLEAIAHGLEQITDLRAEMEEMRAIIEELSQNVAAFVASSSTQGRDPEPSSPAVSEEVVIVETYEDANGDGERSEPPGAAKD